AEEVVLDELEVRIVAELLVVDEAGLGVRAYYEPRHAQPVAADVDPRRRLVVVEATPVVPGEEDRGAVPARAAHDRVDQRGDVRLAGGDGAVGVFGDAELGGDPGDVRQPATTL